MMVAGWLKENHFVLHSEVGKRKKEKEVDVHAREHL